MLKPFFNSIYWRRAKLRIWKTRLSEQFQKLAPQMPDTVRCSLDISWGPFYGGAVVADRAMKTFKLMIRIPYDGYLTKDEQNILERFRLRRADLPYFILFHEYSHLLDALSRLKNNNLKECRNHFVSRQQMAQPAADYRNMFFEEQADRFAYKCILQHCRKAG